MAPHRWLRMFVPGLALAALFAATTATAAPATTPKLTPVAGALDPYLPDDTEVLVTINVRQILDSEVVKKNLLEAAREGLKGLDQVQTVLTDLGFDPFKDLDKVLIAGPGGGDEDRGLVIVRGRFDLAKFKKRGAEAARDNSDIVTIHKVADGQGGQFLIYEVKTPVQDQEKQLFVALASREVALASFGKDYVVDALKKNAGKAKAGVKLKSKEFATLLARMDGKQSVSFAAVGKALTKGSADLPAMVKDLLEK